jgi:hypothetical protein
MMRFLLPAALAAALLTIGSLPRPAAATDVLTSGEGLLEACNEFEQGIKPGGGNLVQFGGLAAYTCWGFMGAMQQVSTFGDASSVIHFWGPIASRQTAS